MRTRLFIVLYFIATTICSARSFCNVNLDSVLAVLDHEIEIRQSYGKQKEAHIASIRSKLKPDRDDVDNFDVIDLLYEEFRHYQSDSAFYYSDRMYSIAENSGDKILMSIARATKFDYFLSVWMLDDALDEYRRIDEALLPTVEKMRFYKNCGYLFFRLKLKCEEDAIEPPEDYDRKYSDYINKLVSVSHAGMFDHEFYKLQIEESRLETLDPDKAIRNRLKLMSEYSFSDHELAVMYGSLCSFARRLSDKEFEIYCNALSVIYDIRSSTHETASVYMLANLMKQSNDIERAVRYIRVAFDDAFFFNSRMKQSKIGMILPLLESMRHDQLAEQRRILVALLLLSSVLLGISVFLVVKQFRHNKRLERMRESLNATQRELVNANNTLSSLNTKLKETIELKDSYIMQSLYVNTSFLKLVETRCRNAINDMKTKGLEAMRFLPYQMGIKEERQRVMRTFDNTFLQVFPNFIDDFNSLLSDGESVSLSDDGAMSTELRIFALMRLGVTDTDAVADFLNISTNSIYVYKARVKAKSKLSKNEFDLRVMAIEKS